MPVQLQVLYTTGCRSNVPFLIRRPAPVRCAFVAAPILVCAVPLAAFETINRLAVSTCGATKRSSAPAENPVPLSSSPESGPPERCIRGVTTVLAGDAALGHTRPLAFYYGARASPLNPPAGIPEIGIFPVFCAGGVFCNEALTQMVKDPKLPRCFVCSRVYPLFINGFSGFPALTSLKRGSRVLI